MKINEIIPRKTIATESSCGMMAAQAQLYQKGTPKKRRAKARVESLQGNSDRPANGKLSPD